MSLKNNFTTKLNYENYSNVLKLLKLKHGIYSAIVAIDFRDFSELFLRTLAYMVSNGGAT